MSELGVSSAGCNREGLKKVTGRHKSGCSCKFIGGIMDETPVGQVS